jgi:hypothetical protein
MGESFFILLIGLEESCLKKAKAGTSGIPPLQSWCE